LTVRYAVLSILEYDDSIDAGRDAPVLFRDAVREARSSSLDEAMRLAPDQSGRIGDFRKRFEPLVETAQAALAIGNQTPGLTSGAELSPADLVKMADGARMAAPVDTELQLLARDLSDFDHALADKNSRTGAQLEARLDTAILIMAAAGFAASAYFRISGRRSLLSQAILRRSVRAARRSEETGGLHLEGLDPSSKSPTRNSRESTAQV
jgi:hypothetical protein